MDPYGVLGIERGADDAEITAAYRRAARRHHPDRHPDDPQAPRRFAEAGAAVAMLRDAPRRAFFDRFGQDPEELGLDAAAINAALAPVDQEPKPSRAQCPKCHGTGWRVSGRTCTFCDPEAMDKPPDTPDWDPLMNAGSRAPVGEGRSRPQRMRLRPSKKKPT